MIILLVSFSFSSATSCGESSSGAAPRCTIAGWSSRTHFSISEMSELSNRAETFRVAERLPQFSSLLPVPIAHVETHHYRPRRLCERRRWPKSIAPPQASIFHISASTFLGILPFRFEVIVDHRSQLQLQIV